MTEYDWRMSTAYYWGFISMLDRVFGEVVEALKTNGFWENTMIVVAADHGDMCGAHGRFDKGPYSYDELMRVPALVRAPGVTAREVTRHVSTIDLNRTMTDWMQIEPDIPSVDSRSLFPLMERGNAGWETPDEVYYRYEWFCGRWYGIRTIRSPDIKYSFNPVGGDELYDLKKDPGELKNMNRAESHSTVKREMQFRLLAHLKAVQEPFLYPKLRSHMGLG